MNAGIIAARYAKALLKYVQETGNGDKVYAQACVLVLRMEEVALLREYVEDRSEISLVKRISLLQAAVGEPLADELGDFFALVVSRRRYGLTLRMLYSFISQYREAAGIKVGRLITALPVPGLKEKLEKEFGARTGARVSLDEKTDPAIIGGFIFELDGQMLDASVQHQFAVIRKSLIDNNNRIV
jgi:F-type H+-transporting ATPase subunit delta